MTQKRPTFLEFCRLVLDTLDATDIDWLVGGALATWAWGEARTTNDLDVVIDLPGDRIMKMSEELRKRDMLVPPEVIIDVLIQPEGDLPLNAIHLYGGFKAELFLLRPGDEYRATTLARRRLVDLGPPLGEVYVHAPEDLILYKVHYYGLSHQTKHIRDVASILTYSGDQIDFDYLDQWAEQLGLTDTWGEVRAEVQRLLDDFEQIA